MEGLVDKHCTQCSTLCMLQIESYAKQKGLQLIGYYHANERFDDTELSSSARKIADKLYANNPLSCAVLVRLPRCKLAQPQAIDTATMLTSDFTAAEHTKLGSISTRTRRHISSGKYLFAQRCMSWQAILWRRAKFRTKRCAAALSKRVWEELGQDNITSESEV